MPRVVIIGAGPGGLSCAIALKRKYGFDNFTIYERGGEVGGTWRASLFGASSDVSVAFYSLSTDLRDWKGSHGSQKELLDYWVDLAKKYNLYPHILLNHAVKSVEWDTTNNHYHIVAEDASTGKSSSSTAEIVISAIGVLDTPRFARIPGLDTFKGAKFHSARWDSSVELRGKRVGVIGNGSSATQFVPQIAKDPEVRIIQFCRTPSWLLPDNRVQYSQTTRWILRNIPFMMRLYRWILFMRKNFTNYIKSNAPKKYVDKLVPTYPLACKRLVIDTDYLRALHQPNLDINWDGIDRIVEDGILTKKGIEHIPLDVIIFATGYAADFYPLHVRGKTHTIQEYYEQELGQRHTLAQLFPTSELLYDFWFVFRPNTVTGHTSAIFTNEVQRKVSSLEVKLSATDAYNDKIQALLNNSVWAGCISWYRVGGDGKISSLFPGPALRFWLWLRKPDWRHFSGIFKQRLQLLLRVLIFSGLLALGASRMEMFRAIQTKAFPLARSLLESVSKQKSRIIG
ncbi:hypothetical protein CPB84DRAFT_1816305 [Gymnopilus junonius]|uniref:Monooxygenase n=1 Tax=Gymnopilus junonius TaxID=109634 RepID=A0A9P5TK69_GYMJU|nr:hypothetical protein CPB84DRAFT_1816305 [Gymnopilus junonius]